MRANFSLAAFFIGLSVVSGCSSLPKPAAPAPEEAAPKEAVGPKLPDIELTAPILDRYMLAEVALQRAQFGAAVSLYRELALSTRDPRIVERATRVALFARADDVALEMAKLWVELDPNSIDARQIVTAEMLKSGDFGDALGHFETLLNRPDLNEEDRYMMMLRLLGREQDKEGARTLMEKYLQKHPDDLAALHTYAQLAIRDGKLEEAEKTVDRMLDLRPDWDKAVVLRTRVLQATNREAEALAYVGEVIGRNRRDTALRSVYGGMLVDAGRPDDALKQFEKVLDQKPDDEAALYASGLIAQRLEKYKKAEGYFKKLIDLGKRVEDASYSLGVIKEIQGKDNEAMKWFARVDRGDNYLNAHIRSAFIQAKMGDVDGARAYLNAVNVRSPGQRLRLFLAEGEILTDQGMLKEALELYDRALAEIPDNADLLYNRAMVSDKMGRTTEMESDLLAILEREPDHVDALNSLGYTLANNSTRLDEAYNYIKRALELRPDAFYILDSMGWVKYRMGELDEAIDYLRHAFNMRYDPEIAAHLGEVLWVKGDHDEARTVWNDALKKSPDNKALLDVIKRLQR